MIINSPEPEHVVTEYEFINNHGQFIQATVDPRYDSLEETDTKIVIHYGERDGKEAEKLTIYKNHLFNSVERTRVVRDRTEDEREEWEGFFKQKSKLVN